MVSVTIGVGRFEATVQDLTDFGSSRVREWLVGRELELARDDLVVRLSSVHASFAASMKGSSGEVSVAGVDVVDQFQSVAPGDPAWAALMSSDVQSIDADAVGVASAAADGRSIVVSFSYLVKPDAVKGELPSFVDVAFNAVCLQWNVNTIAALHAMFANLRPAAQGPASVDSTSPPPAPRPIGKQPAPLHPAAPPAAPRITGSRCALRRSCAGHAGVLSIPTTHEDPVRHTAHQLEQGSGSPQNCAASVNRRRAVV